MHHPPRRPRALLVTLASVTAAGCSIRGGVVADVSREGTRSHADRGVAVSGGVLRGPVEIALGIAYGPSSNRPLPLGLDAELAGSFFIAGTASASYLARLGPTLRAGPTVEARTNGLLAAGAELVYQVERAWLGWYARAGYVRRDDERGVIAGFGARLEIGP